MHSPTSDGSLRFPAAVPSRWCQIGRRLWKASAIAWYPAQTPQYSRVGGSKSSLENGRTNPLEKLEYGGHRRTRITRVILLAIGGDLCQRANNDISLPLATELSTFLPKMNKVLLVNSSQWPIITDRDAVNSITKKATDIRRLRSTADSGFVLRKASNRNSTAQVSRFNNLPVLSPSFSVATPNRSSNAR